MLKGGVRGVRTRRNGEDTLKCVLNLNFRKKCNVSCEL